MVVPAYGLYTCWITYIIHHTSLGASQARFGEVEVYGTGSKLAGHHASGVVRQKRIGENQSGATFISFSGPPDKEGF